METQPTQLDVVGQGTDDAVRASAPRVANSFRRDAATDRLLLLVGTLACLLPFVGKPVHIDDPLFIWTAQQIQRNATDFYGFNVNWYGTAMPMHLISQNPPGAAYYLALVAPLTDYREIGMHLAFLLPNLGLVLGTYALARRFTGLPLLATIAGCATPAVIVSATTLMSDTLMMAFWCWGMVLWLAGLDRRNPWYCLGAGVLIAAAALTKYFGICALPLLIVYTLARERRLGWWFLGVVAPACAIVAYEIWAHHLYGHGLFSGAARYAIEERSDRDIALSMFDGLVYLGGCMLTLGLLAPWLWPYRVLVAATVVGIVCVLIWSAAGTFPKNVALELPLLRWLFPIHAVTYLLVALGLLTVVMLDPWHQRTPESMLLALWFIGTLVFAVALNWTITARTLVPLAPVGGILVARRLEWLRRTAQRPAGRGLAVAIGLGMAVSLLVAWADSTFAQSQRQAASALVRYYTRESLGIWFQGHWGFQYYIEKHGALPIDLKRVIVEGDTLLIPIENTNVNIAPPDLAEPRGVVEFKRAPWIAAVALPLRTNFYAAPLHPYLPFVIGPVPPDRVLVERIRKTVRLVPRKDGAKKVRPTVND